MALDRWVLHQSFAVVCNIRKRCCSDLLPISLACDLCDGVQENLKGCESLLTIDDLLDGNSSYCSDPKCKNERAHVVGIAFWLAFERFIEVIKDIIP